MSSLNQVQIIGRLGGDPEVRHLPNGDAVANLTVATSEKWKDKQSGEQKEKTEWHRLVIYGKLAEVAGKYLKKGSQAFFQGKLQTREWEKDGVKRYTTEIIVNQMTMLGSPGESGQGGGQQASRPAPQQQSRPAPQPAQGQDSFDDIPFAPIGLQEGRNFLHMI